MPKRERERAKVSKNKAWAGKSDVVFYFLGSTNFKIPYPNTPPGVTGGYSGYGIELHLVWCIGVWSIRVSAQILGKIRVNEYSEFLNKGHILC